MPTALAFDFGALRQAVEGPDGSSTYQGVRICQALFDLWQESRIAGVAGGNQYIAQKARHSYPLDRAGGEKCAKALIVQFQQIGETRRRQFDAGQEVRLLGNRGELVPGTDRKAIVAAIDPVAHEGA